MRELRFGQPRIPAAPPLCDLRLLSVSGKSQSLKENRLAKEAERKERKGPGFRRSDFYDLVKFLVQQARVSRY